MSKGTNPSLSTILALVNSMIGGTMLTLPILFMKSGILIGIAVLVISGFISYKTCRIYILHLAQKDNDVEDSIKRIMSASWEKFFKLITGYYLVFLNIIYIELIIDQVYNIIFYILTVTQHSDWIAPKGLKALVFDKFSVQYLSLLCFLPLLAMAFIKNLEFLVKLTALGFTSVAIYIAFVIYEFGINIGSIDWNTVPLYSTDLGNLAGTCALAFTIHTTAASVIKRNQFQKNNQRDLRISYVMGLAIYILIGAAGCLAVLGNSSCKVTIIDCFLDDWRAVIVQVAYLMGLLTVYPCFLQVGRSRLLLSYFPEIKSKTFTIFNLLFMVIATSFTFLSPFLPLDLIMNLVGSVFCFFFVYMIPARLHIQCLYNTVPTERVSLLTNSMNSESIEQLQGSAQCPHEKNQGDRYPKSVRQTFYFALNLIGVAVAIYGVYQFVIALTSDS